MRWITTFWASGARAQSDACDETVINGARYDDRPSGEKDTRPLGRPDTKIAEEIKRRQLALVARYVATVRGR